jgi:hypothetical protein
MSMVAAAAEHGTRQVQGGQARVDLDCSCCRTACGHAHTLKKDIRLEERGRQPRSGLVVIKALHRRTWVLARRRAELVAADGEADGGA